MKKFILLAGFLIATNCFSAELHNFNQIKTAVISGQTLHIVVDFTKCATSGNRSVQATMVSVFTPDAIGVLNDHVATSLMHFTLNNPAFQGKAVYEFVRYTLTADNNISLSTQVLDAVNYAPLADKISFNCKIDAGAKIYV